MPDFIIIFQIPLYHNSLHCAGHQLILVWLESWNDKRIVFKIMDLAHIVSLKLPESSYLIMRAWDQAIIWEHHQLVNLFWVGIIFGASEWLICGIPYFDRSFLAWTYKKFVVNRKDWWNWGRMSILNCVKQFVVIEHIPSTYWLILRST